MPQICHEHCPKEGGGLALLVIAIIIFIAVGGAVHAAAHEIEHTVEEIVTIGAIALGSGIAVAVLAYVGVKVARNTDFRAALADPVTRERERIARAPVAAIEAPKADPAAEAIMRQFLGAAEEGARREQAR